MKPVNLESVRASVEILRMVKRKQADLKELEAEHRGAVEEALGDNDEGELDGEVVVKWTRFKSRSLNQKALKEANPDLVENYYELSEKRRFEVT